MSESRSERHNKQKKPLKTKIIDFLLILILITSLGATVYYAIPWVEEQITAHKSNENVKEALSIARPVLEDVPQTEFDVNSKEFSFDPRLTNKPDVAKLKETNEEIIGWIYIPGTNIDEPITQTTDNEWYLTHDWNNEYSKLGAIFLDSNSSKNYSDILSFTFGHQTYSDNKFTQLHKFMDDEFTATHNKIYMYSDNRKEYVYEVFGAEIIPPRSDLYLDVKFEHTEEDLERIKSVLRNYQSVTEDELNKLTKDSNLMVLVTCVDTSNIWERRIVIAKLTEINNY